MGIIYKSTNKVNKKVYIGLTTLSLNKRKKKHKQDADTHRYNSYFHSAIRKYGWDNFKWEVIDKHNVFNVLQKLERLYVIKYESNNRFWGYNLTEGGEGSKGLKHTEKSKTKMRKSKTKEKRLLYSKKNNKCGFPGTRYSNKNLNPWRKVWQSLIRWKGKQIYLGNFQDPLSASIVYKLVLDEITS